MTTTHKDALGKEIKRGDIVARVFLHGSTPYVQRVTKITPNMIMTVDVSKDMPDGKHYQGNYYRPTQAKPESVIVITDLPDNWWN